jgi:hypothetical protein
MTRLATFTAAVALVGTANAFTREFMSLMLVYIATFYH